MMTYVCDETFKVICNGFFFYITPYTHGKLTAITKTDNLCNYYKSQEGAQVIQAPFAWG